jgi:hypothetical protein
LFLQVKQIRLRLKKSGALQKLSSRIMRVLAERLDVALSLPALSPPFSVVLEFQCEKARNVSRQRNKIQLGCDFPHTGKIEAQQ